MLKTFDIIRLIMCLKVLKIFAFKTIFHLNYLMLKSLDIIRSIMCLIILNHFKTIFHLNDLSGCVQYQQMVCLRPNCELNHLLIQVLQIIYRSPSWDFLCMSPIQQIDYKEHCVLRTRTLQQASYLLCLIQHAPCTENMLSTTTKD